MKPYIGGQAVIEGVMMKGPKKVAVAVRKPTGGIAVKVMPYSSATSHFPLGLPFIRGIVFLFEMLALGMKTLLWSADQQMDEKESLSGGELTLTVVASLAIAIGLFLVVPYAAAWLVVGKPTSLLFNLVDGIVRLLIFLAYIWVIGWAKDVKRLYEYHGAEHAAVNCFEADKPLTVANARRFSTIHPRCGTSLLAYVIGISIVVFSLIRTDVWYLNLFFRLLTVPVIGGIGYELLRLSARYKENRLFWLLALPGRWTQRITTQRPDAKQLEVAIAALKKAL
jgi:uncharacterized protein YqhQ